MKMSEIISENEAENIEDCLLCKTHEEAYKKIPDGITCPYCNHNNEYIDANDYTVVGMANYYDPNQNIGKYPVFNCIECGEYIALMPEKVNYNANHDVYYTGGKDYLNDDDENNIFIQAQEKIEDSLNQWKERIAAGEKLDASYPALWIKRDITHAIASYLYEKGLKK